jgi:hypothetical protein
MKRIFIALFCLCMFVMTIICAAEPPISTDTTEVLPLTSGEPSVPSGPLAPETSVTDSSESVESSEPTEPSEPSTSTPEESEGPDVQPTPEELLWAKRWEEYPVATEIWLQMKSYGWTDAACAGIMGNIMRETGGDTLKYITSNLYNKSKSHYGLCQWAKRYYPQIQPTETWTPSIMEQIEFLRYTINNQKTLHHSYGFTEEYLLTATDYREVAKKFCDGYERPAENSTRRENNAEKAWKYFVLGEEA